MGGYHATSTSSSGSSQHGSDLLTIIQVAELKDYFSTHGDVPPGPPIIGAPVASEPALHIDILPPASTGPTEHQGPDQAPATTWKKHPFPFMQHFYVPVAYDGRSDDTAPLGTGMTIR